MASWYGGALKKNDIPRLQGDCGRHVEDKPRKDSGAFTALNRFGDAELEPVGVFVDFYVVLLSNPDIPFLHLRVVVPILLWVLPPLMFKAVHEPLLFKNVLAG